MEIIAIEEKVYELMKEKFKDFHQQIKELCRKDNPTEWLDNQDVCELINISKRTLQSYRDKGVLPYSQTGYKCYYKKSDIEALIEKSRIKNDKNGNKE